MKEKGAKEQKGKLLLDKQWEPHREFVPKMKRLGEKGGNKNIYSDGDGGDNMKGKV